MTTYPTWAETPEGRWPQIMEQARMSESEALKLFTAVRWKTGAFCPYCKWREIYHFANGRDHKCAKCLRRFSIKVGTIFEGSKMGFVVWLRAIELLTGGEKITSVRMAKELEITQKSAWWMMLKLRAAARTRSFNWAKLAIAESSMQAPR